MRGFTVAASAGLSWLFALAAAALASNGHYGAAIGCAGGCVLTLTIGWLALESKP